MTETYSFKSRLRGLTDMPAEFQKAIDCTLTGFTNTFCFPDDISILRIGRTDDY